MSHNLLLFKFQNSVKLNDTTHFIMLYLNNLKIIIARIHNNTRINNWKTL